MKICWLIVYVLLLALVGCANPHNREIPQDLQQAAKDPGFQEAVQKLPQEERELLTGYLARKALAQTFGGNIGANAKTIGEAITQQKQFVTDQKAKEEAAKALAAKVEAERAQARKAMDDTLTVALTRKGFVPSDVMNGRIKDFITVSIALENKTDKIIKGVKGEVEFADMFGDKIRSITLTVDDEIGAKSTIVWDGTLDYNQFIPGHSKLKDTAVDKLKATWTPNAILFADGSSLKLEPMKP